MPKKSKKQNKHDDTLKMVVDGFQSAWDYTNTNYHSKWFDSWKLYNNERVDEGYKGISKTFVPMVFSTIETMVASLAGSRPRFDYRPTKKEQETDTKVLNSLLDFYWDADKWQSKVDKWIRSMLMYGTGVIYVWWDIDRPRLENIPLRDFFVDPTATSPETAQYMGRRFLTSKDELDKFQTVDPETSEMVQMYTNLDKISADGGSDGDETDKEEKDMFNGSTLGESAKYKQIEVIEYWTQERVIAVANRSVVIRDDVNPYMEADRLKHTEDEDYAPTYLLPFVIQRDYIDESLFFGKCEIDPIAGLQEDLNDITNQNKDAITYALNPMYTLDPQYADWIEQVESVPGAVYPFEANALQAIQMGNVPSDAFNERINIKNEIREVTASDQVVKGVSQDTTATATEIGVQVAQAGQRLAIKISQIENEGYYDLAETVLAMIQLFIREPTYVKVIGQDGGVEWDIYDPEFYDGTYEPHVQLEATVTAKQEKEMQVAQDTFLALRQDPLVNQEELYRIMLPKIFELDTDEVNALLNKETIEGAPGLNALDPLGVDASPDQMDSPVAPIDFIPQNEGVIPSELINF